MRRLIWKEWRENRLTPIWIAAVLALLEIALWKLHAIGETDRSVTISLLYGSWIFAGIFAGAGAISKEVGSGSLSFLMSLPVTRRRVWWNKLFAAVGILFLSMLLTTGVWAGLQKAIIIRPFTDFDGTEHFAGWLVVCAIACLALSMAISTVLDRAISTAMLSIVAAIAVLIGYSMLAAYCQIQGLSDMALKTCLLAAFSTPSALFASYWAFTRGESLRSLRRFGWLAFGAGFGTLLAWTPSIATYEWMGAFRPTGDRVIRAMLSPDGSEFAAQVLRNHVAGSTWDPDSYASYHLVVGSSGHAAGTSLQVLPGGKPLAFSPDGRYLVYDPAGGSLGVRWGLLGSSAPAVFDVRTGRSRALRLPKERYGYQYMVDVPCWSRDGRWLALSSNYGAILVFDIRRIPADGAWSATAGLSCSSPDAEIPVPRFQWTADNRYLLVHNVNRIFAVDPTRLHTGSVQDDGTGRLPAGVYPLLKGDSSTYLVLSQNPHRARLVYNDPAKHTGHKGAARPIATVVDLGAKIQAAAEGRPATRNPDDWAGPESGSCWTPASISPDGKWVAATMPQPRRLVLWHASSSEKTLSLPVVLGGLTPVGWIGGRWLWAKNASGEKLVIDAANGRVVSLDGRAVAGSTPDGTLFLYSKEGGQDVRHLFTTVKPH